MPRSLRLRNPRRPWRHLDDARAAAADFKSAWDQTIDGDTIQIAVPSPVEVGSLQLHEKRVSLTGPESRTILLFKLPPGPQGSRGLWRIEQGSLTLTGLDLYVDLTRRTTSDSEIVLFELNQSDLRLIESTITVLRGSRARD